MATSRLTSEELKRKLGDKFVETTPGNFVHVSQVGTHAKAMPLRNSVLGAPAPSIRPSPKGMELPARRFDIEPERASKPSDPEHDEVLRLYARTAAILVLLNFRTHSSNELKWKHWSHHLAERRRVSKIMELSAFWKIPFGGRAPQILDEKVKREIAFIRYGGRRIDDDNLRSGLKSVRDQLTELHLIADDSITYLKAHYAQVPGGQPKLEILFLNPQEQEHGFHQ